MDFYVKYSKREKIQPVTKNDKIHGFCDMCDFRLVLVIGSIWQTDHKHPKVYLSHVHVVV